MKFFSIFLFLILLPHAILSAQDFESWKKGYIARASKRGIPSSFIKKHFENLKFDKKILKKDKNQITSNKVIIYDKWIKKWLRKDPSRIEMGKEMLIKHRVILEQVEKKYHVDKEIIVSLWGVETLFGAITGDNDLISSLSALAYKSRRKKFFEIQLNAAFRLLLKGHVNRENLKGSWAGATGQMQFMPSNFNGFARDFDGDGKKDIWTNHGDIFASIAYFLKRGGWKKGEPIGIFVKKSDSKDFNFQRARSPAEYNKLGVTSLDGKKLEGSWKYQMAKVPFKNSPFILKGPNYKTLMAWNNSSLFAAFNMIMRNGLLK